MSKLPRKRKFDEHDLRMIEGQIRSAGNYVVPSDDLRPRVVEAARDRLLNRFINRCFLGGVATCLLLWSLSMPFKEEINRLRDVWTAPSTEEVERMTQQVKTKQELGPNWALAEVFVRLREAKARTLSRMFPGISN